MFNSKPMTYLIMDLENKKLFILNFISRNYKIVSISRLSFLYRLIFVQIIH